MNPVLQKMMQTQQVIDHAGSCIDLHSNINEQAGQMLQKWIKNVDCSHSVEVGLAFGVSSLYILDEVARKPNTIHYGIDPMQFNDRWHGIGLVRTVINISE